MKDYSTISNPFILFITGVSTAGKTTVYEKLKRDKSLSNVDIRDIDEDGIPPIGLTPWRAFRIEQLFYEAANNFKQGTSTIVCGVSFPNEIISSKLYNKKYNIHFLLLEIPYPVFKYRIDERIEVARKKGDSNEIFKKENYQGLLRHTKTLIKKMNDAIANQRNGHILPSTNNDITILINSVKKLISEISTSSKTLL